MILLAASCGSNEAARRESTSVTSTSQPATTIVGDSATTSVEETTSTTVPCQAETAAPWLLELEDLEYTAVDRYKEHLPEYLDIEDMFPPGMAPMEYWVASTEVMMAPDGSWYPGITSGMVLVEGVKIYAAPCVADLVADELERRGIPILETVYTDGEPMLTEPLGPMTNE